MEQLEIEYFWPLTEQIKLDLDFKPCEEYEEQKRRQMWSNSVVSNQFLVSNGGTLTWASLNTTPNYQFKAHPDSVGYWECTPDFSIWRKEKPNWFVQKMTRFLLGWKWKDK